MTRTVRKSERRTAGQAAFGFMVVGFIIVSFAGWLIACSAPGLVRNGKLNEFQTRSVVRETAAVRNLPLQKSLAVELIRPEFAKDELMRQFAAEMDHEALSAYSSLLRSLKLLPHDFEPEGYLEEKLQQGVGGYYDIEKETLRLVHSKQGLGLLYGVARRIVQRDMAGEFLLAHETAHALADQHFGLGKLLLPKDGATRNTDALLAHRAFIEGDAMLTGFWFTMGKRLRRASATKSEDRGVFDQAQEFFEIPIVLRRPLLFLYFDGFLFASEVYRRNGTGGLDGLYRRPPRSTEEILHAEKYFSQTDPPIRLQLPALASSADASVVAEDTLGELGILSMLLSTDCGDAAAAAAGWGGDRYRIVRDGHEKGSPIDFEWKTVWDTERDAQEFSEAFSALLTEAFGEPKKPGRWKTESDVATMEVQGVAVEISLRDIGRENSEPGTRN